MRVKTGPHRRRRHKKVLSRTKGFRKTKSKQYRSAKEADLHAGNYAFAGRKLRKRDFRRLWITRINASLNNLGISYSRFIYLLRQTKVGLNRKMLAELALKDPDTFTKIVKRAKSDTKQKR
jgi:large subunit ribosomal protein L20